MEVRTIAMAVLAGLAVMGFAVAAAAQTEGIRLGASGTVNWNSEVSVKVEYTNGSPVRNASVVFNGTGQLTNGEGRAVIAPANVGTFEVVARKDGFEDRDEIKVRPVLHLELSRGVVPLNVETPVQTIVTYAHNGTPARGVTVSSPSGYAVTADDGVAVVPVLSTEEGGRVTVSAARGGAGSAEALLATRGAYVFGISTKSKLYWTLVFLFAFVVVGAVVVNQLVSDTLVLKE